MKVNRIIFLTGLILISLAMVSGIGFTSHITLEKPIFLRYCIETEAISGTEDGNNQSVIQLQYITNRFDTRKVVGVSFPEVPQLTCYASETPPYGNSFNVFMFNSGQETEEALGKYSLHTVYITQYNLFKEEWNGQKELNLANFQFSDGSRMTADIGRIILYSDIYKDDVFSQISVSSSSDFTSSAIYRIEEDITILNTDSSLIKELPGITSLNIDGKKPDAIAVIKYKKGSSLTILSSSNPTLQKDSKYDVYDIRPKIYYKKSDNTTGYLRLSNIIWQRNFYDFQDALDYLKERGVI